jgi:hypothetical protein
MAPLDNTSLTGAAVGPAYHEHPLLTEKAGTVDPSAAAGVAAPIASTFRRDNAGTGELWLKTGASDVAWTKLT